MDRHRCKLQLDWFGGGKRPQGDSSSLLLIVFCTVNLEEQDKVPLGLAELKINARTDLSTCVIAES